MPASLLSDMNSQSSSRLEEQRYLQSVALELSAMELSKSFADKLGLGNADNNDSNLNTPPSSSSFDTSGASDAGDQPLKKSANMTAECVDVPTSEHVAEIVGRQGCKIKALRAKTNTYIRTPVRGEAPVFVVTGRKEDVLAAKREILSAADHFSQIRASRRNNSCGNGLHGPPSPNTPGQVTIQVRVPYRVVGLVVGPKGATIKRIQQQTQTYIVTPSRDKEPIFEVTGLPDNVEKARHEIESHIALRTGGGLADGPGGQAGMGGMNNSMGGAMPHRHMGHLGLDDQIVNDFQTNGIDAGSHELGTDLMSSMYKPPSSNSAFSAYTDALNRSNNQLHCQHHTVDTGNIFAFPSSAAGNLSSSKLSEHLASASHLSNGFSSSNTFGLYDSDEGIGSSPSFDGNSMMGLSGASIWSDFVDLQVPHSGSLIAPLVSSSSLSARTDSLTNSLAPCLSPTESASLENGVDNSSVRRLCSDPLSTMGIAGMSAFTPLSQAQQHLNHATTTSFTKLSTQSMGLSSSTSTSPTDSTGSLGNARNSHSGFVALDNDVSPW